MAAEFGEKDEVTPKGVSDRIRNILEKYNLPQSAEIDRQSLVEAVSVDKKGDGDMVSLILLEKIGKAVIRKIQKRNI